MSRARTLPDFVDKSKSLYQVLGVSDKADEVEIKQKYLKLSRLYHPDRHANSKVNQEYAHQKFPLLEFAKRVLLNPIYRYTYDKYGYDGLSAILDQDGTENVEEVINDLAKLFHSKNRSTYGKIWVPVTLAKEDGDHIGNFLILHGIQKFIGGNVLVRAGAGNVFTQRSIGNSFLEGSITWFGNMHSLEFGGTIGSVNSLKASYERTVTYLRSSIKVAYENSHYGSVFSLTLLTNLTKNWSLRNEIDSNGTYTPRLSYEDQENDSGISLQVSRYDIGIKKKSLTKEGYLRNISIQGQIAQKGISVLFGRKVCSKRVRLEWETGINSTFAPFYGVSINLYGYLIDIPITVPVLPQPLLTFALIAPPFLYITSSVLYDVISNDILNNRGTISKEKKDIILQQAEHAQKEIALMRESVDQIIAEESARGGLIIIEAWYGDLTASITDPEIPPMIDVTIPLQFLVHDSRLKFSSRESKSTLDGFYDPCVSNKKQLWVKYQFKGKNNHTFLVNDNQSFSMPKQIHQEGPKRPF